MGHSDLEGAADRDGLLFGTDNVFVGDGAAFPAIGVANPMLTLTAMGYRLADHLSQIAD
jgi:choline dehydrogenase-like flavoprotein